jgi:uncharacterized protein
MIVKKHNSNGKLLLAISDSILIGKKFIEKDMQLDLSSQFYLGSQCNESELKRWIPKAYVINAVGEKSISFLANINLVNKNEVKKIDGIPYAHIFVG